MKPMFRIVRRLALTGGIAALGFASVAQAAPNADPVIDRAPSAEAMTFDLFVMRPLGLVGTLAGAAVFLVALPVNLITWNLNDPARRLVGEPAKFTFTRPLGDLH